MKLASMPRLILAMIVLAFLAVLAFQEAVIPDADDCAARGQSEDCWKDEASKEF